MSSDGARVARTASGRVALAILIVAALGIAWSYREQLSLAALAEREDHLRQLVAAHPWAAATVVFAIYVAVTALALPAASGMSLVIGWLFGFTRGTILVSFASTCGATCSFLLSRYFLGERLQARYAERLATFNAALEREGPFYLFSLRLIPYVPFFVINLVMGLTKMRARTFWWVSQLGMLPGTCVYLWAGSSVGSLSTLAEQGWRGLVTPQLALAFVALGLFPLAARRLLAWLQKPDDPPGDAGRSASVAADRDDARSGE